MAEDYKNTPEGKEVARLYADILPLSRPSSKHPKMDLTHRAKIFSPYDALRGFDEEIASTGEKSGRIERIDLSDEQKAELSALLLQVKKGARLEVRYFASDPDGLGKYKTAEGTVTKVDPFSRTLEILEKAADAAGGKMEKSSPILIRFEDLSSLIFKSR